MHDPSIPLAFSRCLRVGHDWSDLAAAAAEDGILHSEVTKSLLLLNLSKEEITLLLEDLNLSPTIRSEALSIEQFTILSDELEKRLK